MISARLGTIRKRALSVRYVSGLRPRIELSPKLGRILAERIKDALVQAAMHCEIYTDLTSVLINEAPEMHKSYSRWVKKWEANGQKGAESPYEHNLPGKPGFEGV